MKEKIKKVFTVYETPKGMSSKHFVGEYKTRPQAEKEVKRLSLLYPLNVYTIEES